MAARAGAARVRARWLAPATALVCVLGAVGCTEDRTDADVAAEPFTMALGGDAVLDPSEVNPADPGQMQVADLVYESLTTIGADGAPAPALARSWNASKDGRAFRFRLDPDATWVDGTPITAKAVVAMLDHVAARGDASLAASRLEIVEGYAEVAAGKQRHLSGVTIPDDDPHAVRVALRAPMKDLPALLSSPLYGVARLAAEGGPEGASGDYAVSSTNESGLNLERRAGARGPQRIRVRELDDADAAFRAVGAGEADWAVVPGAALATARAGPDPVVTARSAAEAFLVLDASDETLSRAELRQAIAAAVDRDELVREVYAPLADPAATVVPDGVPGRDATTCDDRCGGRDLARARALLAGAYPDGKVPTVRIDVDESADQRTLGRLLAAQLGEAGIPTEVHAEPRPEFQRRIAERRTSLFSFGWIGLYPSPGAYLDPLLRSSSPDNVTGLADNAVNAALDVARTAEGDAAASAWAGVEREALARAVLVPLAQYRVQVVVSPRVEGLRHRLDGTFSVASLRLDR